MNLGSSLDTPSNEIWVDKINKLKKIPYWLTSILFGVSFFIICLLISVAFNFCKPFLSSFVVYMWFFGICFVFGSLKNAKERLIKLLDQIYKLFKEPKEAEKIIKNHFIKIFNFSSTLIWSLIITVSGEVLAFFSWNALLKYGETFLIPRILPQIWYEPPYLSLKFLLIMIMGIPALSLIGTASYQLIKSLFLWENLSKLDLQDNLFIVVRKFHSITTFHLNTVIKWFVGVIIIAIVAFKKFTPPIIAIEVTLSTLGFLFFFLPLFFTKVAIIAKKENLLKNIEETIGYDFPDARKGTQINEDFLKFDRIFSYYQQIYSLNPWLANFQTLTQLLLALSSSFIVTWVSSLLKS
jgi:hypothetical protein